MWWAACAAASRSGSARQGQQGPAAKRSRRAWDGRCHHCQQGARSQRRKASASRRPQHHGSVRPCRPASWLAASQAKAAAPVGAAKPATPMPRGLDMLVGGETEQCQPASSELIGLVAPHLNQHRLVNTTQRAAAPSDPPRSVQRPLLCPRNNRTTDGWVASSASTLSNSPGPKPSDRTDRHLAQPTVQGGGAAVTPDAPQPISPGGQGGRAARQAPCNARWALRCHREKNEAVGSLHRRPLTALSAYVRRLSAAARRSHAGLGGSQADSLRLGHHASTASTGGAVAPASR